VNWLISSVRIILRVVRYSPGSTRKNEPFFIATVTADLIQKGIKAGDVVKAAAGVVGGRGAESPI
jgi:hypothetical protein